MLNDIGGNSNFEENAFKLKLFLMSLALIVFFWIWHFRTTVFSLKKFNSVKNSYPKVHKFLCSYCPLGRMSCIRRYRRNVLSLKQKTSNKNRGHIDIARDRLVNGHEVIPNLNPNGIKPKVSVPRLFNYIILFIYLRPFKTFNEELK